MIALELYRQRIGTFRSKLTANKCQDVKLSRCLSREQISCIKTIFILCTVGLCLALLGCHLEERENVGWPIIIGTTCHGILCFTRSVCEQYLKDDLKGDMLDNVIGTLKFRNSFYLFSYGLTKEQKYKVHDDSEVYTPKEPVYVDNASHTPEPVDVSCTFDRHGTASYLLGNSGQHAYNGNPPKRRDNDTPSTSMDEEIKYLHYTMINELDGHLNSSTEREWRTFTGFLRVHLQPRDIAGVTTMFEVSDMLELRGIIKYGEYDKLKKLFSTMKNQTCSDIVDRYSTQMKEIETQHHRTQQASPDKSRNPSENVKSEVQQVTVATENVRSEVQQVAAATENVRSDVKQIAAATENVRSEVQQVADATENIRSEVQQIREDLTAREENVQSKVQLVTVATDNVRSEVQQVAAATENVRSEVQQIREDLTAREETSSKKPSENVQSKVQLVTVATENVRSEVQQVAAATENVRSEVQQIREDLTAREETSSKKPSVYMESVLKSWKEDDKLCYETKGVKAVKEKICNQSCVCVIGVPGSGKSTAIRHAALHIQKTSHYTVYPIKSPKEVKKHLDKELEQDRDKEFGLLFVIDDVIGEHFVDKEKLDLWDSYNDEIRRCLEVNKNVKILISLRLQLCSDEELKGKTYIFNDPNYKVNFSDKDFKLSLDDMKSMLRHYLEVRNVGNTEALIEEICGAWWWSRAAQFADYFPLLCKVFSDNESVRENPEKFFTAPFPALTDIFRQIKSKNKHQFCGLLLCAFTELFGDYFKCEYPHDKPKIFTSLIKSQKLDPKNDLDNIKKALQALDGVYVSQVANKYYFLHSTFRDITTFLHGNEYVIFQHAERDFINSRVRLFSKLSEDDDYVLVLHREDCVELLANRMIHELKCQPGLGAEFIVYNPYIDDERVVNGLCTKLFDSKDTDITQDMVDELFGRCMWAVWRYSVQHRDNRDEMSWPCCKLLVRLIPRADCARRMGDWGTYPILLCVATGSVSLTSFIAPQNNVDINAVDRANCSVLHRALVCGNNVEMTRYLLSLPHLTQLNHRDDYGTPYWWVVQGRKIANRQEMLDMYKKAGAASLGDSSDDDDDADDNMMIH